MRVLHKFLMKISKLDSHKFLILIKVSIVAHKCQKPYDVCVLKIVIIFALSLAFVFVIYSFSPRRDRLETVSAYPFLGYVRLRYAMA